MSEIQAVLEPEYWRERLKVAIARGERHHAVFHCPRERWLEIVVKHREILEQTITDPDAKILDIGCGWGRLLSLMPFSWRGFYTGVDVSPEFIELGKREHPYRDFICGDARSLSLGDQTFDWAIMISVRPMIKRNLGDVVWEQMEREASRIAKRLLFLEYDPLDQGSIE
jgi:SAM-dependent methyltransferase